MNALTRALKTDLTPHDIECYYVGPEFYTAWSKFLGVPVDENQTRQLQCYGIDVNEDSDMHDWDVRIKLRPKVPRITTMTMAVHAITVNGKSFRLSHPTLADVALQRIKDGEAPEFVTAGLNREHAQNEYLKVATIKHLSLASEIALLKLQKGSA